MAYLFEVINDRAIPNTETLLISPFKEIWERDTSKDKSIAIKEFTFIELYSSKKKSNPYAGYESKLRAEKIIEKVFNSDWTPDELVSEAINNIVEFQINASPTYSLYLSTLKAAKKTEDFLEKFSYSERTATGAAVYKPNDILSAIAKTTDALRALVEQREKVEQELFENTKTKSNKKINTFER